MSGETALHEIVYISSATRPMGEADLQALLRKARENNTRLGVTGMLLYIGGGFMQLLEGPHNALRLLLERIRQDRRHANLIVILERQVSNRSFPDWSMGYRRLDEKAPELEGFLDLPHDPRTFFGSKERLGLALQLLRGFQENNF
jgi:hypothetical protein